MSRMPSLGSLLPGGYVLGALHHTDRISLIYEATLPDGVSSRASAQVLHPLHVEELRSWFELGGVLQQQFKHPNLPAVVALGYTDNGLPVMITEWLDGRTLRQELSGPRLPAMSEVMQVVREVGSALEYLHARNPKVLHRAVMPENVLRVEGQRGVKLLGIGQADRPGQAGNRYLYVPPEAMATGATLSPSVDVFSLAVLSFELITGKAPFRGDPTAVAAQMQRGALPYITGSVSEAMQPIDETLHRAWHADPWERTQDVRTFLVELDDAVKKVPAGLLARQRALMEQAARAPSDGSADATTRLAAVTDTAATRHFGRPRRMTETAPRHAIAAADHAVAESPRASERRIEPRRLRAESERVLAVESGSLARAGVDAAPETVDVGDAIISVDNTEIDDPAVLEAISEEVTDVAYVAAWTRLTDDLQEQITNVRPLEMIVPPTSPRRPRQRQATQAGPAVRPGWQPGAPVASVSASPSLRVPTPLPRPTVPPSPAPSLAVASAQATPLENPKFPLAQGAVIRTTAETSSPPQVPSWDEWSPFRHQRAPVPWHRRELRLTFPMLLAILVANGLIIAVLIAVFTLVLR